MSETVVSNIMICENILTHLKKKKKAKKKYEMENLLLMMLIDENAIFSMPTTLIDKLVQTKNHLI